MKKLVLSGLVCAGALLALPDLGYAHGGQYRGPSDVVPPNPGGGGNTGGPSGPSTPGPNGPSTPGPSGPSTPGPSGPSTGGPSGPGGGAGPITGGRGAPVGDDLNKWQFWWEFNKDPFINLKEAIHSGGITTGSDEFFLGGTKREEAKDTMKPTESEVVGRILPALKRALDSTDQQRDIVSSCLIAMAKIGKDNPNKQIKILDEMKARLKSRDQEIRETAAIAMGITQMPEAIPDLIDLATDTEKGRSLCDRSDVDYRTRSFACYALGLIAYASNSLKDKTACADALIKVLEATKKDNRNLPVSAINGLRLVRLNASASEGDKALLGKCVDALWSYYTEKLGQGDQQIQAHVPPAIARLLGRDGDPDNKYKDRFLGELSDKFGKRQVTIYQSCALALGKMAKPAEEDKNQRKYSLGLLKYSQSGKNEQTRHFCLMALGQIGGNTNRNELLRAYDKGSKAIVKPWAAISLGVLAFNAAKAAGDSAVVDTAIGRALHDGITSIKNEQTQAALAVALGLVKYREAADDLEGLLIKYKQRDEVAGYLCIGLALMDNKRSIETIRNIVEASIRRPGLLKQAAIALGKLGDKGVTDILHRMLTEGDQNVAKLSAVASALGYIGDRRTIDPLIKMLHDDSITDLSRAFAAVALGGVADKEPLPWNSKIATDINYRASVETLTNQQSGILDLL